MQYEEWRPIEGQEMIEEFDLNTGGLVGAVTCIEGTGQLVTGTRNDESVWNLPLLGSKAAAAAAAPLEHRLTVHTIRNTRGRVLGLGSLSQHGGSAGLGDNDGEDDEDDMAKQGWEPVVEAWTSHEGAVTGIDVAGGFGNLGGVAGLVTAGGDGCLRLFQLAVGDDQGHQDDYSGDSGPSLILRGQAAAHTARATGVAATRRRAVTVGEDGAACLVDLQRLAGGDGGGGGGGGGEGERGGGGGPGSGAARDGVIWTGSAKGALPLMGVTFQGESEEVFATVGCHPGSQLVVWDARADGIHPVMTTSLGRYRGNDAPYLCVASQPFTPEVFACGVSTGELLLWDVRAGAVSHELQGLDKRYSRGGTWGVAFHPRRPRSLFSCSGSGVLTKWSLPAATKEWGAHQQAAAQGYSQVVQGARHLYGLPSQSALVGVCYDEAADCVSAVSKHGHVVVAQGVEGLRL